MCTRGPENKNCPGGKTASQTIYDKIALREDPKKWVYHNSGHMLFSGSDKGELKERTTLHLNDLLEMIKGVSK
jgi:hypothetical protein